MKKNYIYSAALVSLLLVACQKYNTADTPQAEPEKVFVPVSDGSQTSVEAPQAKTEENKDQTEDEEKPLLTISDGPEFDFGTSYTTVFKTFTLKNTGKVSAAKVNGANFQLPTVFSYRVNAQNKTVYPGLGGTCGTTLSANATCTIVVAFTPPASTNDVQNDRIMITYSSASEDAELQNVSIRIKGATRIPANLTYSGQTNFNPNATLPLEQEIVLRNIGDDTAKTLTWALSGTNASSFAFNNASTATTRCQASTQLAKNGTCSIFVRLTSATPVAATATVTVTYDGGNGNKTLTFPVNTSLLVIQDPSGANGNFGSVYLNRSKQMEFTIRNTGSAATGAIGMNALASEFTVTTGTPQYSASSCNFNSGIGSNVTCSIFITYTPVASSASSTIRLNYDGSTVQSTYAITGQRVTVATVSASPSSVDFGASIFPASATFTFSNSGGTTTNIASPTLTGSEFSYAGGTFPGTGANCTSTNALNLNSGNNCTVRITFTPNVTSLTPSTGNFSFSYNDGLDPQTLSVSLTGSSGGNGRVGPASNTSGSSFGSAQMGSRYNDDMGNTIAIDGDTMIVGAPKFRAGVGAAYIFAWDSTAKVWQFQQMLTKNVSNSFYGTNVGISGSRIFVSTININSPINRRAAAQIYVYTKGATTYGSEVALTTPTEVTNASSSGYLEFGSAIAFNGNTIAVGAPNQGSTDGSAGAGAVYVYTFNGTSWSAPAKVVTSTRVAGARFGSSLSISGSTMLVGAPYESSGAGAAYTFTLSSGTWSQQQKLTPTGTNSWAAGDYFGSSVSIQGSNLVIGSPYHNFDASGANAKSNAGAAFVYALVSGTWTQRQKLVPSTNTERVTDGLFGISVSIAGSKIIVGAPYNNLDENSSNSLANAGAAFAYFTSNGGTSYSQVAKLVGSGVGTSRSAEDSFGYAVFIAPTTEHVGIVAPNYSFDPTGTTTYVNTGAVFMYK